MSRLLQDDLIEKKPSSDFEERLVAQFRQAAEGNGVLEARAARSAWALFWSRVGDGVLSLGRMPSVQWSGALAVLVGLVGVGALLTHEGPGDAFKALQGMSLKQRIEAQGIYVETALKGLVLSGYVDTPYQYKFASERTNGVPDQAKSGSDSDKDKSFVVTPIVQSAAVDATSASGHELALAPGDIFSPADAAASKKRLENLGYFDGTAPAAASTPAIQAQAAPPAGAVSGLVQFSNNIPVYHNGALASSYAKSIVVDEAAPVVMAGNTVGQAQDQLQMSRTAASPAAAPLPPATATATDDSRKVIRNAHLEFEVAKFDEAVVAIDAAAKAQGGFIDTKDSAQGANGKISGTVTVKVLPDHLDAFLAQIGPIGDLKNQRIGAEDITKDYYDTDARLRNAQKMEQRLLDILDQKTGKVSELLQVEQELGRVRSQIEQMQGEMKAYDALIRYATVTIVLNEKDLTQAAAFVIREQADLQLLSSDVEKAYQAALAAVAAAHGQVLESSLVREDGGRVHGSIRLQVDPEGAEGLIAGLQALGRVAHFSKVDQEVAQGGEAALASDTAETKRERVAITLSINHDEEVRQTVALTVVGKEVEALFAQAKEAAAAQGAELLNSNLQKTDDGSTVAHLTVRVPSATFEALRDGWQGLGRVTALTVNRNDGMAPTADAERAPVEIDLTLADEEALMEETNLTVLTDGVDAKVAALKQEAAGLGITVKDSTFTRTSEEEETAEMVFRMPLSLYGDFLAKLKALGKVEGFTEQRTDRLKGAADEGSAPVEIDLQLHHDGNAISTADGAAATVKRTLAEGAAALTWSLRMIGVALAFLLPWIGLGAAAWGAVALVRRMRRKP